VIRGAVLAAILCGCALGAHAQTTDQGVVAASTGRDTITGGAKAAALTRLSMCAGDAVIIANVSYATDDCQPALYEGCSELIVEAGAAMAIGVARVIPHVAERVIFP
jgi:hypothetical protein